MFSTLTRIGYLPTIHTVTSVPSQYQFIHISCIILSNQFCVNSKPIILTKVNNFYNKNNYLDFCDNPINNTNLEKIDNMSI